MRLTDWKEKIDNVIGQMTLEEKIGMIHGAGLFRTAGVGRLNIPPLVMSDGPMGVRAEFADDCWKQIGNGEDFVTYCPSNSAIAMTWNRELSRESGTVLGEEARGRGKDVILGPGINIKRNPLCGRNFEYFSEDPFATSALAVPFIEGVESADVAACVKHFALNSQETERLWVNVEIDERTLREIYLPGFEAAVKYAGSKSVMGAYNLFRGIHCCENPMLLGDILRKEWNYDGLIVSDWGGVHHTKAAAESPLDVEMSVTGDFDDYCMAQPLLTAVKNGEIQEEVLNEKIRHILYTMIRLKMIRLVEDTSKDKRLITVEKNRERFSGAYNTPQHRKICLETARESIVLLKNERDVLPFKRDTIERLLVIGDNGARLQANGGGSAEIKALYEMTPLMGLNCLLGGNCRMQYARGYYVPDQEEKEFNWQAESLEPAVRKEKEEAFRKRAIEENARLRKEALEQAAQYEHVIYVGGLNHEEDVEGKDRESMTLPYKQDSLIEELLKIRPEMVIVMMAGSPVSMRRWSEQAKAIVWYGYSGMEGGTALAEVLFGMTNPSGKLSETLPYRMEDCGVTVLGEFPGRKLTTEESIRMDAHLTEEYRDGVFVGYRYYDKYQVPVQFPFGHGLSYTTFAYQGAEAIWRQTEEGNDILVVTVDVTNAGMRDGKEVIQVYVGEQQVSAYHPVKELKGFTKVFIPAGETRQVSIAIPINAFAHYQSVDHTWKVKAGNYVVYIGSSLTDIRETIEVVCEEKECDSGCSYMM